MYSIHFNIILIITLAGILLSSCYEINYNDDKDFKLRFSLDTMRFDTVFTTVGSATRILKVYNDDPQTVKISEIFVEEGDQSFFRFNMDGVMGNMVRDIDVPGNDSIYIFGEVTVNPDLDISASPFVLEDRLIFNTNGNEQMVRLEAWGQNANYVPNNMADGGIALLSCDLGQEFWNDPKPYVIYGVLVIDSCELVIAEGTQIYVHGGVVVSEALIYNDGIILVFKGGKLNVQGTAENPVTIQGDRLEESFESISGQWAGIRILDESTGNVFNHTSIKNSIIGLRVDSLAEADLDGCQIYNTTSSGLIGNHANRIYAKNSIFHSNGSNAATLVYGGDYQFDYCSFASYGNQSPAFILRNYRCQDPLCLKPILVNGVSAFLRNCIIAGSGSDEIIFDDGTFGAEPSLFQFGFENSLLKIDTILNANNYPNFFESCTDCFSIQSFDPLFVDVDEKDFHLDTLSQAEMKAKSLGMISEDLDGNFRDPIMPDVGCYESQF